MAREVRMPPLGTTSDELSIVEWLKAEGDEVGLGEPLLVVETDKATLEVEAAAAGTLLRVTRRVGDIVPAGTVIAFVGAPGDDVPGEASDERSERVAASPAVRKLAQDRGIDLAQVQGSGPGGRVEKQDVLAAAGQPGVEGEIVSPHRQALARRLGRSAAIPQFTVEVTVDMTSAAGRLERERPSTPGYGYTHVLLKAMAVALRAHPGMNCLWVEEGPRRLRLERADVGLAVAGEDTLLVVTIPEPDKLSPIELVEHTERAVKAARAGRIPERHRAPAAVTLSNLGAVGVDRFAALIDPAQTAILAAGAVVERPGLVARAVAPVLQLELTLTADHRVVDGMVAGRFLVAIRDELDRNDASEPR